MKGKENAAAISFTSPGEDKKEVNVDLVVSRGPVNRQGKGKPFYHFSKRHSKKRLLHLLPLPHHR